MRNPRTLHQAQLTAVLVGVVLMLAACDATGTVAPRLIRPAGDYVCANALLPSSFRLIYSPDGKRTDTTGLTINRYIEPHRSKDTVWTTSNQGGALGIIFGPATDSSHVCVTLFDSLNHHLPNVRGAIGRG